MIRFNALKWLPISFLIVLSILLPFNSVFAYVVFDTGETETIYTANMPTQWGLIRSFTGDIYYPTQNTEIDTIYLKLYSADAVSFRIALYSNTYPVYPGDWDDAYLEGKGCYSDIVSDDFDLTDWYAFPILCDFSNINETEGLNTYWVSVPSNTSVSVYHTSFRRATRLEGPTPSLNIQGVYPESGIEITSFDSPALSIAYNNFDWDIYNGFVINFQDENLIKAKSIQFLAEDLDPDGTGTEIIDLTDFEIDENGKWYLTALGFGTDLDIEGGMFLTTRGYVDFWTDELVDPEYYLNINITGLPSPYTFDEPETWYSENVLRFDSPTTFFTSFTDIFGPIFEKIAEFGNRILPMFNQTEAYDRGYALGEIFPIARGYISKIDMFFGGFPLASFLTYIILIMLGIFIFRIIMKFIPFLG